MSPPPRALAALRRLRHLETDEARRALAEALTGETAIMEQEAAITREVTAARAITGAYDQQAYALWIARVATERTRFGHLLREAGERTADARAALAARRMAETAAEEALERAREARATEEAHRDQVMLEDISRSLRSGDTI